MLEWFRRIWIGSDPVEFESTFGMTESIERLKAATRRWGFFSVTEEVASGRVTESRVSLQRVIPMVGNSFKPFFVGRFEVINGNVVLRGRYTLHWLVRMFMGFWLSFCTLFTALALVAAMRSPQAKAMPFASLAMLVFGLGLVWLGGWFSRNDPAWLSAVIRKAIEASTTVATTVQAQPLFSLTQKRSPPKVILVVSGALFLLGFMSLASAITGVQSYQGYPGGSISTYYPEIWMRYAAAVYGAVMLPLAIGIYRQKLTAWRMGFVVLIGGAGFQVFALLTRTDLENARIPAIVFCVLFAVVTAVWGRWWYAQRVHFHD
ncbi:hypothetical protein [Dyella sp. 2HG41-7]|uniref:hypothetical protein n=1 Tax=Dyella sp. 2HG41-7 TaxID=2883239 RepID=UPI001F241510|nr:hypothetical protein [Dyella sp. 2HG41-7]